MAPLDTSQFITGHWGEQRVSYTTRDLLLYAVGVGCQDEASPEFRYIYEMDPNFAPFPTYPLVLNQKGETEDLDTAASADSYLGTYRWRPKPEARPRNDRKKGMRLEGVRVGVDAERYVERLKPIPKEGGRFTIRQRLMGVHQKGSGALVESEAEMIGEDGSVFYKFTSGGFQIGAKNFTDSGRTNSENIIPPPRPPDKVIEQHIARGQAQIYRLSADYNPLHVDPNYPGVKNGKFEGPILHGLCSLGHAARAVLGAFANYDEARFNKMAVRFAAPVYPGNTLVTKCWKEAGDKIIFTTECKESGKVVLSNAYMQLHPESKL